MKTTGNLGLKKPDGTDIVDIADLNGNMDILDTAVKATQDHVSDAVRHITAGERTAWNAKASTAAATTSAAGLMAAADKAKLDGVAAGANNYVHPTGDGNQHVPATGTNNNTKVLKAGSTAGSAAWGVVNGSEVAEDASHRFATDAEKTAWNAKETPTGAQTKATAALSAANAALNTHTADYVRQPAYSATSGTAAAYTVTLTPAPASISEGFGITIVPHVANSANPTLNINGLGAAALKDQKGVSYAAGKLAVGKPYMFRKVGTDFLADSAGGSGNAVAGDIRAGKTAATDAGDVVGTLSVQTGGTVTPGPSAQVKAAGIYDTPITVAGVSVPAAKVLNDTTIAGTRGTMPNRTRAAVGGYTTAVSARGDNGGSLVMEPPAGYYEPGLNAGGFGTLIAQDGHYRPDSILSGRSIFGVQGSIPLKGAWEYASSAAWDGGHLWIRIPQGAYLENTGSGSPEIAVPAHLARADGNIQPHNIREGVWVYGVVGTMAQGRRSASGSYITNSVNGTYTFTISGLSFRPSAVLISFDDYGSIYRAGYWDGRWFSSTFSSSGSDLMHNNTFMSSVINGDGFTINRYFSGQTVYWTAIE